MRRAAVTLLVVLPIGVLIALFAPNFDGNYTSGCACIPARDGFAYGLDLARSRLDDVEAVTEAFRKQFPLGSDGAGAFEGSRVHVQDTQCYYDGKAAICTYLYEENEKHKRGYQVTVNLDAKMAISGVSVERAYRPGTPSPAGKPIGRFELVTHLKDEGAARARKAALALRDDLWLTAVPADNHSMSKSACRALLLKEYKAYVSGGADRGEFFFDVRHRDAACEECRDAVTAKLGGWLGIKLSGLKGSSLLPEGCVGYREDINASREGALCVAAFLGPNYRVHQHCGADGFPYPITYASH